MLPTLAAFGSLAPGVGPFFAFRILVVGFAIVVFFQPKRAPHARTFRWTAYVAAMLVGSGLFASVFAENLELAGRTMFSVMLGLLLCLALIRAVENDASLVHPMSIGWLLAFLATFGIAIREQATGIHLSNYLQSMDLARVDVRLIASVFGNPNTYAVFLVSSLAFTTYLLTTTSSPIIRTICLASVFAALFMALSTGSRLCLLAIVIQLFVLILMNGRRYRSRFLFGTTSVAVVLLSASTVSATLASLLPEKLATATPAAMWEEIATGSSTSGGRRLNLYLDGLWMVWRSGGLGVGPGNFPHVMQSGEAPYPSGGVTAPHNFAIELLSEFGVLPAAAVFLLLGFAFWRLLKGSPKTSSLRAPFAATLLASLVSAIATSGYLVSSSQWMFIACVLAVVARVDRLETDEEFEPAIDSTHTK